MAKITLAGVDALTESGGTVSLPAAVGIAAGAVDTAELANDAVTTAKIADSPTLVTPNLGVPSAITLTNASFPSGHIIGFNSIQEEDIGSHISTSSTSSSSPTSTGYLLEYTTKESNTNAFIRITFYSSAGDVLSDNAAMYMAVTEKHVNNNNFTVSEVMPAGGMPMFQRNQGTGNCNPVSFEVHMGTESGMSIGSIHPTWTAGTAMYFRFWFWVSTGTGYLCHSSGSVVATVQEIMI